VKRYLDVITAAVILALLSPLLLLIAIIVRLDSEGPILFSQERVGYDPKNGEQTTFRMYKFRSMRHASDQGIHQAYITNLILNNAGVSDTQTSLKMVHDARITHVGRLLRKSSLDELPQLINVIKGEMSLVGPRPALPYETVLYQEWHKRRLQALPGMTGWWQVKGRNRVSFDEMVCMDIYYIEHACLGLDLRILLLTPLAVVSGKGAG
jgi:lipopolysaccharide/colanic/teichoic acid biosynthesis glycosyltransferase